MPPKAKLPRRSKAKKNELNLEAVSEERIDAVTAEPLDPVKFIEVMSPDQTLRLFYNTSTLIRIAVDKGGFMQPPHFREPMANALRKRIEDIEGKKFHFEARNEVMTTDEGGDGGGVAVLHRHVYFDQIIDEFYLLNPAEVYVCPVCYEHYMKTRYVPAQLEAERTVRHLSNGRAVVDPLSVLAHMAEDGGEAAADDGSPIVLGEQWDTILAHVVFRKAHQWKTHMERHHAISGVGAGDYRLRDVLCTYYSEYNQWNEEKYETAAKQYGDAKKRMALTQQRYWHINASYNRLRYNRVVAATELAESHPEAVTETAFPNETIAHYFNPEYEVEDDFIDDDDSEEDDYVRPYSPTNEGFGDEELEESEESEESETAPVRTRKRGREQSAESESDVSSQSTSSSRSEASSTDSAYASAVHKQRALFKRGLLAERDCYYSRLSAEDRRFVERSQHSPVSQSQLYDPRMHAGPTKKGADEDDIDWENIGESLPQKKPERVPKANLGDNTLEEKTATPARATLLLDDSEGDVPPQEATAKTALSTAPRLLLDDDE